MSIYGFIKPCSKPKTVVLMLLDNQVNIDLKTRWASIDASVPVQTMRHRKHVFVTFDGQQPIKVDCRTGEVHLPLSSVLKLHTEASAFIVDLKRINIETDISDRSDVHSMSAGRSDLGA